MHEKYCTIAEKIARKLKITKNNSLELLIVNFTKIFELFEVLVFVAQQISNYKEEKRKQPAKIMILTAHGIEVYASNKNNSHETYDDSHSDS